MLIEFRVENFRSFREEQVFSLVASKDEKLLGNTVENNHARLLKSAALYGANASGKSNLFKAMEFFDKFVEISATRMNQGDPIPGVSPFRLDDISRSRPSIFEIAILLESNIYRYGFSVTHERVYDEWLVVSPPKGPKQGWLDRQYDPKSQTTSWSFGGPLKKDQSLLKERTRDNGLALSRGADLNVDALSKLFLWFKKNLWTIDSSTGIAPLMGMTMSLIQKEKGIAERIIRMILDADTGIERLEIEEQPLKLEDFSNNAPEGFQQVALALEKAFRQLGDKAVQVQPKTYHRISNSQEFEEFDLEEDESNGTQHFFALAGPFVQATLSGATVFVDEIDCSMHPLLTRKLIEWFQSPEVNKTGAQLVFTTHDSSLMDLELFRRDQIWLAEKNSASATELFSLYDFKTGDRPRNTEAIERNYLAGRYGGVPRFGALFEDLGNE